MRSLTCLDKLDHIWDPAKNGDNCSTEQKLNREPLSRTSGRDFELSLLTVHLVHSKSPSLGPGFQPLVSDSLDESRACGLLNPPSSAVQDWTPLNGVLLDIQIKPKCQID